MPTLALILIGAAFAALTIGWLRAAEVLAITAALVALIHYAASLTD